MNIHFIAIGGAVMHNLAIALHLKGYHISGSDDKIGNPSRDRLAKHGILPRQEGWFPKQITTNLDAVILGMHARPDNMELIEAQRLGIKIYSFPEYIYEQTRHKTRVVIAGSHGKTTTTSMVMHVLKYHHRDFDYLVGAQLDGFETMVRLTQKAEIIIIEGDEYLSSPIDRRPKFHLYKPHIALITGIAWDHINVFPTFEIYKKQFQTFIDLIEPTGSLVYFEGDKNLNELVNKTANKCKKISYLSHNKQITDNKTYLLTPTRKMPLHIFGEHNLQNLSGAMQVCRQLGISDNQFYDAISHFQGAARRLQKIAENQATTVFLDFAHSPSKLKATVQSVKSQFADRQLVACMELHTFSSLNADFTSHYQGSMQAADLAIVFYNPQEVARKNLNPLSEAYLKKSFGLENMEVFTDANLLKQRLLSINWKQKNLLMMSSGSFSNTNIKQLAETIIS